MKKFIVRRNKLHSNYFVACNDKAGVLRHGRKTDGLPGLELRFKFYGKTVWYYVPEGSFTIISEIGQAI